VEQIKLNTKTGLTEDGHVTLLVSRAGMGKTTTALLASQEVVRAGKKVIYVSLEIGKDNMEERIAKTFNVTTTKNMIVVDAIDWNRTNTENNSLAFIEKISADIDNLGLVVIDYMQLFNTELDIMKKLEIMARRLKCPVLALAQMPGPRDPLGNKRPLRKDVDPILLKGAYRVIGLYRQSFYTTKNFVDDMEYLPL
jgi:replicative DNA helicase